MSNKNEGVEAQVGAGDVSQPEKQNGTLVKGKGILKYRSPETHTGN